MFKLQYHEIPKYFIIIYSIIFLPFKTKRAFAWTSIYINNQRNENWNQLKCAQTKFTYYFSRYALDKFFEHNCPSVKVHRNNEYSIGF